MSTLGIGGALSKQYQVAPALIQGYDEIHGLMRRLQTVWRLPFHISNLASGFFQARMNGVSMGDAGHGMMDALRLLWRQKDFVKRYDRYAKTFGRGTGVIPMLSTTRRAGIDGVKMLAGAEDYVFRIGDQDINISELLQKMVDNNLFGSFVSEGLRGSDSVTRTLERIRDMAEAGGVKGTYLRVTDKATKIGESSEILVRLAGVMSNLRAGMHMDDAITMTKNAMVDYAKVTPIEKTWLKRVFSYYTFPRHYIPFAWKRFGEDPQIASKLAHTVKSALGNGLLVDEGGNVEVRLDDWRVNVQRMDANMDALMSGAAIVNFLMPETQGKSPSIEGAPASPAFLEAGPLATPIMHALLGSDREVGDKSFVGEVASAVPQIRYFMDPLWNKPEINYSPLELAAATLLPTRKVKEKHEQRVLVARFKDMERFIRRELVHANARGDDDAVQLLQEDLQQAGAALRASVERLEK
jgi:hypothetical protein